MPKDFPRTRRIAEQIQRELAELVRTELKDPRVAALVTITDVEVSNDQAHAKVFFTVLGDTSKIEETAQGLTRAAVAGQSGARHSGRAGARQAAELPRQRDRSL